MLDDASLLGLRSYEETGGIGKEYQWRTRLLAKLDKLSAFRGASSCDRAVITDHTAGLTFNVYMTAESAIVKFGLEL